MPETSISGLPGGSAISTAAMALGQVSNTIRVAETGVVKAETAIGIQSSTTLVNAGMIGGFTGIRLRNFTQVAMQAEITNIRRIE